MKRSILIVLTVVLFMFSACQSPSPKQNTNRQDTTNYTVHGDVIIDKLHHLMWENDRDGLKRTYEDAKKSCSNLILNGYDDWRLPTAHEVVSILDYTHDRGLYPIDAFKYRLECGSVYCSSFIWTTEKGDFLGVTVPIEVDTFTGKVGVSRNGAKSYSKCVRDY